MIQPRRKMALAVLLNTQPFVWRYEKAKPEGCMEFEYYRQLALTAERGKFDILFLADSYGLREDRIGLEGLKGSSSVNHFEVMTLLSALAVVTSRIGLVATASTTYNEPYNVARKFASIDYLSGGRAGWNAITSGMDAEAHNFNLEQQLDTATRYERADEMITIVRDLWDSWEDDAVLADKDSGDYFNPAQVHHLNHRGKHFKVRGPLNMPRPLQGHPIICQAGGSEAGWELAAKSADVMYAKAIALDEAQKFYVNVKGRLAKYGRTPEQLKVLPGLVTVVGRTEEEAREKFRAVQASLRPEEGYAMLRQMIPGIDLSVYPLDEPVPDLPEINEAARRYRIFLHRNGRRLTVREVMDIVSAGIGHLCLIGTASQIADTMIEWVNEEGADGFNLMPHYLPGGLDDFVNEIVPELQARGAFRTEYQGTTLRDILGLPRPASRFVATVTP
jgi:FMN-dependent oxidoreductase (nitrilotriacetate monooxygenase family)